MISFRIAVRYYTCVVTPKLCEEADNTVRVVPRAGVSTSSLFTCAAYGNRIREPRDARGCAYQGVDRFFAAGEWDGRVAMLRRRLICCSSTWPTMLFGRGVLYRGYFRYLTLPGGSHAPLVLVVDGLSSACAYSPRLRLVSTTAVQRFAEACQTAPKSRGWFTLLSANSGESSDERDGCYWGNIVDDCFGSQAYVRYLTPYRTEAIFNRAIGEYRFSECIL